MDTNITNRDKKLSAQFKTEIPNEVIEEQTKKIPNLVFLTLGLVSMGTSFALALGRKRSLAAFVGQWVPTLLIFGVYNKLVKVEDEVLRRTLH